MYLTRTKRPPRAVAVFAALALGLAACGDDGTGAEFQVEIPLTTLEPARGAS